MVALLAKLTNVKLSTINNVTLVEFTSFKGFSPSFQARLASFSYLALALAFNNFGSIQHHTAFSSLSLFPSFFHLQKDNLGCSHWVALNKLILTTCSGKFQATGQLPA